MDLNMISLLVLQLIFDPYRKAACQLEAIVRQHATDHSTHH
jgi:hypothetical protein